MNQNLSSWGWESSRRSGANKRHCTAQLKPHLWDVLFSGYKAAATWAEAVCGQLHGRLTRGQLHGLAGGPAADAPAGCVGHFHNAAAHAACLACRNGCGKSSIIDMVVGGMLPTDEREEGELGEDEGPAVPPPLLDLAGDQTVEDALAEGKFWCRVNPQPFGHPNHLAEATAAFKGYYTFQRTQQFGKLSYLLPIGQPTGSTTQNDVQVSYDPVPSCTIFVRTGDKLLEMEMECLEVSSRAALALELVALYPLCLVSACAPIQACSVPHTNSPVVLTAENGSSGMCTDRTRGRSGRCASGRGLHRRRRCAYCAAAHNCLLSCSMQQLLGDTAVRTGWPERPRQEHAKKYSNPATLFRRAVQEPDRD